MAAENSTTSTDSNLEDYYDYYDREQRVRAMLATPQEVIAIVIGLLAIALNLLVFAGLYQVKNRITTHYRLIISLAASDLIVAVSVVAHLINKVLNPVYKPGMGLQVPRLISKCTFLVIKGLNTTGLNVTLLNLMAMALDHYVAIMKPLQYPALMTKKRIVASIIALWVISFILGFSDFFSAIGMYKLYKLHGYNYCEMVWATNYHEEYTMLAVASVCFIAMFYAYVKIYIKVRHHQHPGEKTKNTMSRRTPKALITTLLNLGSFMITWLPLCLFQIILLIQVHYDPDQIRKHFKVLAEIDKYLFNLLMLNSIADSIIYTVRVSEVQIGLRRLFRCPTSRHLDRSNNSTMISRFPKQKLRSVSSTSTAPLETELTALTNDKIFIQ